MPPPDAAPADEYAALEAALGHSFTDRGLLRRALTHSSVARTAAESNERLEFLGDAVLGAAGCAQLFREFPGAAEGDLTRLKSARVSRRYCAVLADRLKLEPLIRTGRGMAGSRPAGGGRVPRSLLSNAFEAVVAAVYLDGGWPAATACVERLYDEAAAAGAGPAAAAAPVTAPAPAGSHAAAGGNAKSRLQHLAQSAGRGFPAYEVLGESGPDHAKRFTVRAVLAGTAYPPAEGASKKSAEQAAAAAALAAGAGGPGA